ncbi:MAG: hypothetical protein COU28_00855 [Candidatus Magasanikbacteria bacterium CG10_big_fil_rev_8_21_14_0_10_36_16]|uniref:HicB family protein n=1 Tax=Candidatus Magasanikbacteria bacterium CG10_big_fil_rev_8_21_14_0_10_36_16 TaxID=1974645 RepID=A0A2H0TZE5_9BACT|nr:MAG: hypothetical protein COU28_00855 [Candidatus Magasanikbacteria bacterium CG10_big_fil_rev_8_21_14_0_10_36_16]
MVTSQGKSLEVAKKNLKQAIELYLEDASQKELRRLKLNFFTKKTALQLKPFFLIKIYLLYDMCLVPRENTNQ